MRMELSKTATYFQTLGVTVGEKNGQEPGWPKGITNVLDLTSCRRGRVPPWVKTLSPKSICVSSNSAAWPVGRSQSGFFGTITSIPIRSQSSVLLSLLGTSLHFHLVRLSGQWGHTSHIPSCLRC